MKLRKVRLATGILASWCALLFTSIGSLLVYVTDLQAQATDPAFRIAAPGRMDSLKKRLSLQQNDTGKVHTLLRITRGYNQLGNMDSLLAYAEKAARLSQRNHYYAGESEANWLKIWVHRQAGRYPEALQASFSNLQLAKEAKDSLLVLEALRHVIFTYMDLKEYENGLEYARRIKKLVHSGIFKNEKELRKWSFLGYMNFMGGGFEALQQYDSALHYKRLAYQTAVYLSDEQSLAVSTGSLGKYFFKRGSYDSAYTYFKKCLGHVETAKFRFDLAADAQLGLAKIYHLQDRPDSAIRYAYGSLLISQRMKRLAEQAEATALLHLLYAGNKSKDSAYKYLALSASLKDSLFDLDKIKETESVKYKEALRVQQVEQEKKEAQQLYKTRLKISIVVGALILLMAFAFFMYRLKQVKRESVLKSTFTKKIHETEMRALRAQMNPHFVFNCLNSINRYIVKSDHKTASNYLTKFSRLIRLILDNSATEYISLDKEVQTLQLYIEMEILRFDNVFEYLIEVDEGIVAESISMPTMLLQPYVENAIWHGLLHRENGGGTLWIRFRRPNENTLITEIEDNGIGRKKAKELKSKEAIRKKSYGMKITEDRLLLINELYNGNGTVLVEDLTNQHGEAAGTKVIIEFPIKHLF